VDYVKTVLGQIPPEERESFLNTFEKIVQMSEAKDIRASRKTSGDAPDEAETG
jgi:hypothetical protein